jgi:hypothetical protein
MKYLDIIKKHCFTTVYDKNVWCQLSVVIKDHTTATVEVNYWDFEVRQQEKR